MLSVTLDVVIPLPRGLIVLTIQYCA